MGGVNGSVAGTFTYTPAAGTVLAVGNNQTLSVSFTPTDTTDFTSATATATINVTAATPSATFLEQDTKTQGNWIGVYGTDGYEVVNNPSTSNPNSLPTGVTVTPTGATLYTWANPSTATSALEVPGGASRIAATWYASTSFTVDVDVTNGQSYNLELYVLDYNGGNARSEKIQLSDAGTGTVLSTETVSNFSNGAYLNWTISGNVLITITKTAGANAVLSGLFFDPPAAGPALATAASVNPGIATAAMVNPATATQVSEPLTQTVAPIDGATTPGSARFHGGRRRFHHAESLRRSSLVPGGPGRRNPLQDRHLDVSELHRFEPRRQLDGDPNRIQRPRDPRRSSERFVGRPTCQTWPWNTSRHEASGHRRSTVLDPKPRREQVPTED